MNSPALPNPNIKLEVLFEDASLFAFNKPSGLPCLPLRKDETQTLMNAIVAKFPEQACLDEDNFEGGMIHRLDNLTSGIVLVAKNLKVKGKLQELQRAGKIQKEYKAFVYGKLLDQGVFDLPIGHHQKNKKKMAVASTDRIARRLKARKALTEYKVLKSQDDFSFVLLKINKGSRHQIRVHLAQAGHSVVGDQLYGPPEASYFTRHLLHASALELPHPQTGDPLRIECPTPKDFSP